MSLRPLEDFAGALRLLRQRAGQPTLRAMARRAFISASTLCRVERGTTVPTLDATLAYVRACEGDEGLWKAQHAELLRVLREGRRAVFFPWRGFVPGQEEAQAGPAALEAYVLDRKGVESLAAAMRRMRLESGMTLTQIAERTRRPEIAAQIGGRGLPVTTISDLCNPAHGRVPSRRTLRGFLLAIDAPESAVSAWERTREFLVVGEPTPSQKVLGYEESESLLHACLLLQSRADSDFRLRRLADAVATDHELVQYKSLTGPKQGSLSPLVREQMSKLVRDWDRANSAVPTLSQVIHTVLTMA